MNDISILNEAITLRDFYIGELIRIGSDTEQRAWNIAHYTERVDYHGTIAAHYGRRILGDYRLNDSTRASSCDDTFQLAQHTTCYTRNTDVMNVTPNDLGNHKSEPITVAYSREWQAYHE